MLGLFRQMLAQPQQLPEASAQRVEVATCVLVLEMAAADGEFSDAEQRHVIDTLQRRFSLSADQVDDLIQAAHEARSHSLDLWKFTNAINSACTPAEKIEILEEVWRVIYVDGELDAHEDYLVHKLGRLLNVDHPTLIKAKLKVLAAIRQQGEST